MTSVSSTNLGHVLLAESTKARSVRSTYWTVIAAVVGSVGLGALLALSIVAAWDEIPRVQRAVIEPVAISLGGTDVALIATMVFGVLTITSEYTTRQISITLAAVPNRPLLLTSKAMMVGLVSLGVGVLVAFPSFFIGQAIFAIKDLSASITEADVFWTVARAAVLIPLTGLTALAVGALLRSSAGAITVMIGGVYLPAVVVFLLPQWVQENVYPYFPGAAMIAMVQRSSEGAESWILTPVGGTVILSVWTVVLLAAALVVMNRRDA